MGDLEFSSSLGIYKETILLEYQWRPSGELGLLSPLAVMRQHPSPLLLQWYQGKPVKIEDLNKIRSFLT